MAANCTFTRDIVRPDPAAVAAAADLPVATVSDILGWDCLMAPRLRPIDRAMRLCGPAVTLKLGVGDNLMMHKAMQVAEAGDILVVDQEASTSHAPFGGIMATAAQAKGLGGLVIDGSVRDATEIREMGFPVFCVGLTPRQAGKNGPGHVNVPVSCGGARVEPGDLVIGDEDGICVIPRARVADVTAAVRERIAAEERRKAAIARGELYPGWLDDRLAEVGAVETGGRPETA
ncbi:4-carboxy-4-hydroxy-2-oxoadipate aldolase/oxaloacetate decarboxylase [Futiania mangrovi]|uniref:Putative 4-hydroxy-4-methyl-2-oxoglutarate aldolase n=1 Tax=Futiania mangrovi TaxID=2959716 RepID=A0A9J6PLP1_9PROT|nr:4-carboxy-4-hydroxy-2-oxoadipate aldolase/oxaloacetate decarboxylase [Futiania mangrovii]MCP1336962.1 4-carboxy-4-hydroxy-2-oxoadipate aldolase/oxaloacetate decarboxylase [Futiania mangrovii]